jgi:hypothetical protein
MLDNLIDCLECGIPCGNRHQRFFCVPGPFFVPNEYYLCEEHKDKQFYFEDLYNEDGTRKPITHSKDRCRHEGL